MIMTADIVFSKEIDKDKHYISPGGYEILKKNDGLSLQFDFEESYCYIDKTNPHILHVTACNLDLDTFPKAEFIELFLRDFKEFAEFYIYIESKDPNDDIEATQINNITFQSSLGEVFELGNIIVRSKDGV